MTTARIAPGLDRELIRLEARWPADHAAVVRGDSRAVMQLLPTGSVDLVFADPPYFLSNGGTTVQSGKRVSVDKGDWDAGADPMEILAYHRGWLRLCQRLLRPSGTIAVSATHHSLFAIGFAMQALGFHLLNQITWFKPNAAPNVGCRQLTHSSETVLWAAPRKLSPLRHHFAYADLREENGGKQLRDVWTLPTTPASEKEHGRHPTQKPLELLRRLVFMTTAPDQVVLDPFCGSGSTGVAARELGRRFIGIDFDQAFVELAARRIAASPIREPQGGDHDQHHAEELPDHP